MLREIANELEDILDDYNIDLDSSDACKQIFIMLGGENVRCLIAEENKSLENVPLPRKFIVLD